MKQGIHPEYVDATIHCSCGETFQTRATQSEIRVEICSKCHPFFTGKQKFVDSGGRVQRFQDKYGEYKAPEKPSKAKAAEEQAPAGGDEEESQKEVFAPAEASAEAEAAPAEPERSE